jgi:circadian clock protein KaiB
MAKLVFHIYIAGTTQNNRQFLQLYQAVCEQTLPEGSFTVTTIDILKAPELAEKAKIMATPTISRVSPAPEKRIIGKLTEVQALQALTFLTSDIQ